MKIREVAEGGADLPPPRTDVLSPLGGGEFIKLGLRAVYGDLEPSFYAEPIVRKPSVYNGMPFQVEVGMVYGGALNPMEQVQVVRYANKVPLLYQPGSCAITQAVQSVDWRPYGLEQRNGQGIPFGPAIILVHVCGIRLPYSSESKEAIAPPVDPIVQEIRSASCLRAGS